MNKHFRIMAVIISIIYLLPLTAKSQFVPTPPLIKYYHSPYTNGQWQTNTIVCHVIPFIDKVGNDSVNVAKMIFEKAAQAWNEALQGRVIIEIVDADITDINLLGLKRTGKNFCAIHNRLTNGDPGIYGICFVRDSSHIKTRQGQDSLVVFHNTHIEINVNLWKANELVLGKGKPETDSTSALVSAYAVATHEMGHLLGMNALHIVPNESIMAVKSLFDYEDYRLSPIQLGAIDKLFTKAMFPILNARHQNDDCLPRR